MGYFKNTQVKASITHDSHSLIELAASDKVQTVQAGADEADGAEDVLGDGGGEEAAAGRRGHRTAVTGMGRTWVSVAQSKSEGPNGETKRKKETRTH